MKNTIILALLAAGLAAAEPKVASAPSPVPPPASKSTARHASSALIISEVLGQNVIIDAGKSVRILANADFSGAERAAFGVYADPAVNITKIRISVWWGMPGAQLYSVQDVIRGSNFPYINAGGASVPVGGSSMFIDVNNDGDAPVTISQLTVYALAR